VAASKTSGVGNYHLAFLVDTPGKACSPAWGGLPAYTIPWGYQITDTLRASGIKYSISFGGKSGKDLSKNCTSAQLTDIYEQVIKTYQPEGLDFDLENKYTDVSKALTVIHNIQSKHPEIKISFTLPVLPNGLLFSGKKVVTEAQRKNLNYFINLLAMNYNAYAQCKGRMEHCAVLAANATQSYLKTIYPQQSDAKLWQMISITPMIGVNDIAGEQFTLANATFVANFAKDTMINSLSMWTIARDQPCSDKTSNPKCSGNRLQTQPYEFSKRFLN
jgi:chitinase